MKMIVRTCGDGRRQQFPLQLHLRLRRRLLLWPRHDGTRVRNLEDVGIGDFVIEAECDGHR
ncbi:MAG: hypothetical protein DMF88_06760 [Acidobacteria bacterium]|nr:MAG: hypothetical protein DMF88_06760 [Acidobacteriota bacterium]